MKRIYMLTLLAIFMIAGNACKSKEKESQTTTTTTEPTTTTTAPPPAPVEVSADETLRKGVEDATKDVKGLTTRVENSVIFLSGTISRADNMRITPTLNSLNPKKIDRTGLTVK